MVLEKQMQEWLQNYCGKCLDTCCNSEKHRIRLEDYSVPLFQEKGISVINHRSLDKFSIKKWKKDKLAKLLLRKGSEVPKPSVVEIPQGMFGVGYYLYSNICPFYDKEKGCEVHEDPRRPEYCIKYPFVTLGCNDPEGRLLDVRVMESCECLRNPEIRFEFTKTFPVRIVDA
jgi:Fe-S-cluster containining protein